MLNIYSLPNCPNCRKLKKFCDDNNIKYVAKDVTEDFRAKARLIYEDLDKMPVIQLSEELFFECDNLEFLKKKVLDNN